MSLIRHLHRDPFFAQNPFSFLTQTLDPPKGSPTHQPLQMSVAETDKQLTINVDVPGMDKENVKVFIDDNRFLTITGERSENKEEERGEMKLTEHSYGTFTRSMKLPRNVDQNKVEARVQDGILKVVLEKSAEAAEPKRQITVE